MYAAHKKLDNFIAFTDLNNAQISGHVSDVCGLEPVADKWTAFGFHAITVEDGNDVEQIAAAIDEAKKVTGKPCMIILKTVKGKGISFIEEMGPANHSIPVTPDVVEKAMAELK